MSSLGSILVDKRNDLLKVMSILDELTESFCIPTTMKMETESSSETSTPIYRYTATLRSTCWLQLCHSSSSKREITILFIVWKDRQVSLMIQKNIVYIWEKAVSHTISLMLYISQVFYTTFSPNIYYIFDHAHWGWRILKLMIQTGAQNTVISNSNTKQVKLYN
jgi:hypothetical protein